MFTPTPEQQAIFSFLSSPERKSLAILALAGTGKTTTILSPENKLPMGTLILAFNKHIAEEIKLKVTSGQVSTLNALGHGILRKLNPRISINFKKDAEILNYFDLDISYARLVSYLQSQPYLPGDIPDSFYDTFPDILEELLLEPISSSLAPRILQRAIDLARTGKISFDDQIYLPAVDPLYFPYFPTVTTLIIDEAQDLSPIQHRLISRIKSPRLVIIGDPNQSIYGFRGADSNSMQNLIDEYSLSTLPLTTSFRSPKCIVPLVTPTIPAFNVSPSNSPGEIITISEPWSPGDLPAKTTILCRNNLPLMKAALSLLRQKKPVCFINPEKLYNQISFRIKLVTKKYKLPAKNPPLDQFLRAVDKEIEETTEKLANSRRSAGLQNRLDFLNSFQLLASDCEDFSEFTARIQSLTKNNPGGYLLSTIHGSKGREWPTVLYLSQHLIPSPFAETPEELQQEKNLHYVALTRTSHTLYFASHEDIV